MFRVLANLLLVYICLSITLLFLLFLSCMIPSEYLRDNIGESIPVFKSEGHFPTIGFPWRKIMLDNFGDTFRLNTAYSVDSTQPISSGLKNLRYEEYGTYYDQIGNLEKGYLNDSAHFEGKPRYWHGYLTYLRPLLVFFSYSEIRILMTFFLFLSLGVFLYNLWHKTSRIFFFSVFLGLFAVDVLFVGWSIHFSGIFILNFIIATNILRTYKPEKNLNTMFLVSGMLTVFIDLLSSPVFALGLLLLISAELQSYSPRKLLLNGISWLVGWTGFWSTKWLLAEIVVPGSISNAFTNVLLRTGSMDSGGLAHQEVIKYNLFYLLGHNPTVLLTIATVLFLAVIKFHSFQRDNLQKLAVLLFLGSLPYVWYQFAANHAYIHFWFTYRDQFVSVVCLSLILTNVVDLKNLVSQFVYRVKPIY